ncbi:MAG: lamin tail domain-containing protein [Deltaproteobacteria bacterium]|nr:lamin tail domain-containing protein [Deltaproteobacteria bacterium]
MRFRPPIPLVAHLVTLGVVASLAGGCGESSAAGDAGDLVADPGGDALDVGGDAVDASAELDVPTGDLADTEPDVEVVPPSPDWPSAGELVITEIMRQPVAVDGAAGEWFEVTNLLARSFDLRGCYLGSAGDSPHLIATSVPIGPGEVRVLGRSADTAVNGGAPVDYAYGTLDLSEGADGISLRCGDELVDAVEWPAAGSFPSEAGAAMQLDPGSYGAGLNNDAAGWCAAVDAYGAGDRGTPGAGNPPCDAGFGVARCRLFAPIGVETLTGTPLTLQGRLRQPGLTDASPKTDTSASLRAEVAWGPDGSNPSVDDSGWTTVEATPDAEWQDATDPGADQWMGTFNAPAPGEWDYAFRFSVDGGASWSWCDLATGAPGEDGSQNGYQPANAGALTALPNACSPNPCTTPPAGSCSGDVETTFADVGTCSLVGSAALCDYAPTSIDCAALATTCDGDACAGLPGPPAPGEVIFTEVLQNPDRSFDDFGEWFELTHVGSEAVNLAGCGFESLGDPGFALDPATPVLLLPGATLVVGASAAMSNNGGVAVDVVWEGLRLGNNDDVLTLRCGGLTVDTIAWDNGATFPDPTGASMQLSPDSYDATANDTGAAWCASVVPFGDGDLGSPGSVNPACPDACDGVPCASPPPSDCLGSVARVYAATGVCEVGTCTYAVETSTDCALTDEVCKLGACVEVTASGKTPAPGDLVIDEILKNPSAVGDTNGEWFEVANVSGTALDLAGCVLSSNNDLDHTIPKSPALTVPAAGFLVFGASANASVNGGVSVDHAWSGIALGNGADSLTIRCDNVVVDTVAWDDGGSFPDPEGAAMQLDPGSLDPAANDDGAHWCVATPTFGTGDKGTPGQPNPACGDSCAGVVCSVPPAPICDGTVATTWEATGTCAQGKCDYAAATTVNCPDGGLECVAGACVEPGSVVPQATPGQLVISEIMQNPDAVGDPDGEWFEVTSLVSFAVDLQGCVVRSKSDPDQTIDAGGPLVLPAMGRLVLGFDDDPSTNGGVAVDYAYGALALGNGADSVAIWCGGVPLDAVAWDGGPKFPDPQGASMQLDPASFTAAANDSGAAWCESSAAFGAGDKGTPGEANTSCPAP